MPDCNWGWIGVAIRVREDVWKHTCAQNYCHLLVRPVLCCLLFRSESIWNQLRPVYVDILIWSPSYCSSGATDWCDFVCSNCCMQSTSLWVLREAGEQEGRMLIKVSWTFPLHMLDGIVVWGPSWRLRVKMAGTEPNQGYGYWYETDMYWKSGAIWHPRVLKLISGEREEEADIRLRDSNWGSDMYFSRTRPDFAVNTKVDMRFNVMSADWLSERVRLKLLQMVGPSSWSISMWASPVCLFVCWWGQSVTFLSHSLRDRNVW